jgi:hypothetical protein
MKTVVKKPAKKVASKPIDWTTIALEQQRIIHAKNRT